MPPEDKGSSPEPEDDGSNADGEDSKASGASKRMSLRPCPLSAIRWVRGTDLQALVTFAIV
jgi:hypothetical protein